MNRITLKLLESVRHENGKRKLAPSLERRRLRAYAVMKLADGILLYLAFALASWMWEAHWAHPRTMVAGHAPLQVYYTIVLYNGSYGLNALSDWLFAVHTALGALAISAGLINLIAIYTKSNDDFSCASVTLALMFGAIFVVALRRAMGC